MRQEHSSAKAPGQRVNWSVVMRGITAVWGPVDVGPHRPGVKPGFYVRCNEELRNYSRQRTGKHRATDKFSYISCLLFFQKFRLLLEISRFYKSCPFIAWMINFLFCLYELNWCWEPLEGMEEGEEGCGPSTTRQRCCCVTHFTRGASTSDFFGGDKSVPFIPPPSLPTAGPHRFFGGCFLQACFLWAPHLVIPFANEGDEREKNAVLS